MGFMSFFKSMPLRERHEKLVADLATASTEKKLRTVNTFFNRYVRYATDQLLHKQVDYWQTLDETLASGKGDCEDYALAKYLTLRKLGVPEEHLRLGWVFIRQGNVAHMVLLYVEDDKITRVLDSITNKLTGKNRRRDLDFKFEFNGLGRWLEDGTLVTDGAGSEWLKYQNRLGTQHR